MVTKDGIYIKSNAGVGQYCDELVCDLSRSLPLYNPGSTHHSSPTCHSIEKPNYLRTQPPLLHTPYRSHKLVYTQDLRVSWGLDMFNIHAMEMVQMIFLVNISPADVLVTNADRASAGKIFT